MSKTVLVIGIGAGTLAAVSALAEAEGWAVEVYEDHLDYIENRGPPPPDWAEIENLVVAHPPSQQEGSAPPRVYDVAKPPLDAPARIESRGLTTPAHYLRCFILPRAFRVRMEVESLKWEEKRFRRAVLRGER